MKNILSLLTVCLIMSLNFVSAQSVEIKDYHTVIGVSFETSSSEEVQTARSKANFIETSGQTYFFRCGEDTKESVKNDLNQTFPNVLLEEMTGKEFKRKFRKEEK
jgi:hypothetical protein